MGNFEINKLLEPQKKVGVVLRIGAIIMSFGCIILFSESVYKLLHGPSNIAFSLDNLGMLASSTFLFWPFSFVALKGTTPKTWSPYSL